MHSDSVVHSHCLCEKNPSGQKNGLEDDMRRTTVSGQIQVDVLLRIDDVILQIDDLFRRYVWKH